MSWLMFDFEGWTLSFFYWWFLKTLLSFSSLEFCLKRKGGSFSCEDDFGKEALLGFEATGDGFASRDLRLVYDSAFFYF